MMNTQLLWLSLSLVGTASAQVFNGPGLTGGVGIASQINGPVQGTLRSVILSMLRKVLNMIGLAGIVMVVIAGVYLIVSAGNETAKDKAKKIILYLIIGIVIVYIAQALIGFLLNGLP